jgi:hypothetical protein
MAGRADQARGAGRATARRASPGRRPRVVVRQLTPDLWPALEDLFGACTGASAAPTGTDQGGESRRPAVRRPSRAAAGAPRLGRRDRGGLVPGDPPKRPPPPGWVHAIRTARRPTGLVGVLLLRPARVPGTRRLLGAARGGRPRRPGGGCACARGVSVDEGPEVVHGPRVHLRAGGLPGGRRPKRGAAGDAPRASTETNVALTRRCPARRPTCCTASAAAPRSFHRTQSCCSSPRPRGSRAACSARSPDRSPDPAWCS